MNRRRLFSFAWRLRCLALTVPFLLPFSPLSAQAPTGVPMTLDQQDFLKGSELADQSKFDEARALFAGIPTKYPTSPIIPQALLKLGYVYFRLNDYPKAVETLRKSAAYKGVPPEVAELALSLVPQVLSAKAAGLPADSPARKLAFEDAVKQFDVFLLTFPNSDEVESANYGKAVALYQVGKYEDAMTALKTNLTKFSSSESVLDSEFLLGITMGTVANIGKAKTPPDPAAEVHYDNAEKLLGDIINRRTDVALANDARFQIGELEFARAGFTEDKERKKLIFARALEAYRQVFWKELVIQAQNARIENIKARRQDVVSRLRDLVAFKKLGRVIEKEQEKLGAIEARADQTVAAKIKMAQIFLQTGRLDEARILLGFIKTFAEDPEQKKQIEYYSALSLASQNNERHGHIKALADKTEEAYTAFRTAYKADPIAENLAIVVGSGFVESDAPKAIKYFQESVEDYPKGRFRLVALAQQAAAQIKMDNLDEALKSYESTLKQNPEPAVAAQAEFGIATIYKMQPGKMAEAIAAFKNLREKYSATPQGEQASFWYGQLNLEKDPKLAQTELQGFIKKYPQAELVPQALFYLAQAQLAQHQRVEALATYQELGAKYPDSEVAPFSYFSRAQIYRDEQQNTEVVEVMREYIKAYPDGKQLFQAYDYIAQIQASNQQDGEALETWNSFVKVKPEDPNAPQALLRIADSWKKSKMEKLGRYVTLSEEQKAEWKTVVDKTIAAGRRLVDEYPESQQVALGLQTMLEGQKMRRDAKLITDSEIEKYFQELADKFKDKPATRSKAIFTLAHLFEKTPAKAFALMSGVYDDSQKYAPADLDLYGLALIDQKKLDEALAVFVKMDKDYPIPPNTEPKKASREIQVAQSNALFGQGKVLQEQKKSDEAKKKFDELEQLYAWSPKMLEANYNIALALFEQKPADEEAKKTATDDALKRLASVIGSKEASSELRAQSMLLLARVHEELGNYESAIDNYLRINSFYASVPDAAAEGLWRGANLLEKQGNGQIPMPKPPAPAPKPGAPGRPGAPGAKPGAIPAKKPGTNKTASN